MELSHHLSLPLFITLISIILFISNLIRLSKHTPSISSPPPPPQPWTLPLIGNLHQLATSPLHIALRDLANKYGPLMQLKLGQASAVVVSSSEIAKEVMKTHDSNFSTRPHMIATKIVSYDSKNMAFAPYGDYYKKLRKTATLEVLSVKRVLSFKPVRDEEVRNLIKYLETRAGEPVELTEKIYMTTFNVITKAVIGKRVENPERVMYAINEFLKHVGGFNVGDFFPSFPFVHVIAGVKSKLEACRNEVDKLLETIISERDVNQEGFLPAMRELQNDPELDMTSDHVKAVLLDLLVGGSETTATTIVWIMAELMKNPNVLEKVQLEIRYIFNQKGSIDESEIHKLKYLKLVIKEVLRLHPPVAIFPRLNTETCVINGYKIPAKSKIIVNIWAIGRDPKFWNDPEEFKPERFENSSVQFLGNDFEYIPFGAGRRICPGITFGMTSVEYFLANLLFHFDWELPNGMTRNDFDMSEAFGGVVQRKEKLILVPRPYEISSMAF